MTLHPPPDGWQRVTLRGGPNAGDTMTIPAEQDTVTIYDGTQPHQYVRVNDRAELWHAAAVASMVGGGGR